MRAQEQMTAAMPPRKSVILIFIAAVIACQDMLVPRARPASGLGVSTFAQAVARLLKSSGSVHLEPIRWGRGSGWLSHW